VVNNEHLLVGPLSEGRIAVSLPGELPAYTLSVDEARWLVDRLDAELDGGDTNRSDTDSTSNDGTGDADPAIACEHCERAFGTERGKSIHVAHTHDPQDDDPDADEPDDADEAIERPDGDDSDEESSTSENGDAEDDHSLTEQVLDVLDQRLSRNVGTETSVAVSSLRKEDDLEWDRETSATARGHRIGAAIRRLRDRPLAERRHIEIESTSSGRGRFRISRSDSDVEGDTRSGAES
jgi:hypothetical protein